MLPDSDIRRQVHAIRARAKARDVQPALGQTAGDAELLAALANGTLNLDQIDDASLQRMVAAIGPDAIAAALTQAGNELPLTPMTTPLPQTVALTPASGARLPSASLTQLWHTWIERVRSALRPRWSLAAVSGALAAIALIAVFGPWRTTDPGTLHLALQWPAQAPFDPATLAQWGPARPPLPKGLPDFNRDLGTLGGAGSPTKFNDWRLATVIVRSGQGFGSGAFISADGWILTDYHVVAARCQQAAVEGTIPVVEIIAPRVVDGRIKPREETLKAIVYRADPRRDLALLKLEQSTAGRREQFFPLANQVSDGQECYVIGSQYNGPAWWLRGGNVSHSFDFPTDLSQVAAGVGTAAEQVDRTRATVIVSDARVSPGDSGGPLINEQGQLIGLTFATSANTSGGSVGWHISLAHLRDFIADLPSAPEGVPFDPWTAGLPRSEIHQPRLTDGDGDGRIDSLRFPHAQHTGEDDEGPLQPAAWTVFVDFQQNARESQEALARVPKGLWGMEDRGEFGFQVFVTTRADGVTAVGYANAAGLVDEVRIGSSGQDQASVVWRRNQAGKWQLITGTPARVALVDSDRLGAGNVRRLLAMADGMAAPTDPRALIREPAPEGNPGNRGPNRLGANP